MINSSRACSIAINVGIRHFGRYFAWQQRTAHHKTYPVSSGKSFALAFLHAKLMLKVTENHPIASLPTQSVTGPTDNKMYIFMNSTPLQHAPTIGIPLPPQNAIYPQVRTIGRVGHTTFPMWHQVSTISVKPRANPC